MDKGEDVDSFVTRLEIVCTDEVFVYCCYVYNYLMHGRGQLCVFGNYWSVEFSCRR